MLKRNLFALVGAAMTLTVTILAAVPANAQTRNPQDNEDKAVESSSNPRLPRRGRGAAAPTPEQLVAAAQAVSTGTNSNCQVTEATLLGDSPEGGKVYEASCATGPGYVFTSSNPPQAIDCVILENTLAKQAAAAAAAAPPPARGAPREEVLRQACQLPANKDTLAVMKAYAVAAGVPCPVDAASPIGVGDDGAVIYEVGCAGTDGYRIFKSGDAWTKNSCLQLVSANATCQFTTAAEQVATVKGWFANSAASACDVSETRFMGSNANGSFYEAKCAAGDGLIARFDTAMAVQQVYPCAEAQRIGGGCKLTIVPAAAPAAAPTTQQ